VTMTPTADDWPRFDDVTPTSRYELAMVESSVSVSVSTNYSDNALVMPLWLPYVCLTIVILSLLAASFVHFHIQRSQASADDGASSSSLENSKQFFVQPSQSTGSRAHLEVNVGTCTPFVSSTPELRALAYVPPVDCPSLRPPYTGNGKRSLPAVGELNDFASVASAVMLEKRIQRNCTEPEVCRPRQAVRSMLGAREFTFNMNGSMVDVRCIDDERTNTFRLAGESSRDSISTLVVMTTSFEDHCVAADENDHLTFSGDVTKTRSALGEDSWNFDRSHSTHDRFRYDVRGEREIFRGRPASTGLLRGEIWRNSELTVTSIKPKLRLSKPADY